MDWVGVIETAYRVTPDRGQWLRGVVEAARPALDHGLGLVGYCFEGTSLANLKFGPFVALDFPDEFQGLFGQVLATGSEEFARRVHVTGPCSTASRLLQDLPADLAAMRAVFGQFGGGDAIGIAATDGSGSGCVLSAMLPRVARLSRQQTANWSRVAAHITAGLRLQRLLDTSQAADPFAGAEAILDARGRLDHATEPAQERASREALRAAAVLQTRACGALRRRDAYAAVACWRALVAGRWSLVDHFDHDGRRFLLARRNDPRASAPRALTLRERQVVGYAGCGHSNKLIAYELGLSSGSVATHLGRAATKLGASSRTELIGLCARLVTDEPSGGGDA